MCARTAERLRESAEGARLSKPLQRPPVQPALRLLIIGGSTAAGTGTVSPRASVAALLGQGFARLQIDNRAGDGPTFGGLVAPLEGDERIDMVPVMAGGNDVVRLHGRRPCEAMSNA